MVNPYFSLPTVKVLWLSKQNKTHGNYQRMQRNKYVFNPTLYDLERLSTTGQSAYRTETAANAT